MKQGHGVNVPLLFLRYCGAETIRRRFFLRAVEVVRLLALFCTVLPPPTVSIFKNGTYSTDSRLPEFVLGVVTFGNVTAGVMVGSGFGKSTLVLVLA